MNDDKPLLDEMSYLVLLSVEGRIDRQQFERLEHLIKTNALARDYYFSLHHIFLGLQGAEQGAMMHTDSVQSFDSRLWEELAHNEKTAETIEIEASQDDSQTDVSLPVRQSARINKFSIYTLLTATAALLLMFAYIHFSPTTQPVVASIVDTMNEKWDTLTPMQTGDDIRTQQYRLLEGYVKLAYDSGTHVVIEAPAEFAPLSANKMLLRKGKAFAHVPANAIGFTIDTPGSSIIDLGTEFGVYVDPQNSSQVHVAQGKINLIAGLSGQTRQSEIVQQAQARQVGPAGRMIEKVDFSNNFFVRDISSPDKTLSYGSPLNLAWVLAGSNGFTPVHDTGGIDPATGQYNPTVTQQLDREGTNSYHPVTVRLFIDGVFVPNGPCVVSSAEHRFAGFPQTSNEYWSDATTDPSMVRKSTNENNKVISQELLTASLYHGDRAVAAPLISLHANQGITFDLDRIRQAQPGTEVIRFKAKCGVSGNVFNKMRSEFWVLIDGQQFFHHATDGIARDKMGSFSQEQISDVQTIDIPILPNQRFLTLAATDGGDKFEYDWCIFENPVLVLAPKGLQ